MKHLKNVFKIFYVLSIMDMSGTLSTQFLIFLNVVNLF